MGSPLSPETANLFMEDFETRDLSSSPNPPRMWLRFVNDTFVIHKAEHIQQFPTHLNSLDPKLQFTTESPEQKFCRPFLDTLTPQGPDGTLITMVYRKPTHTDQYQHWDSHHSITNKYSIYNTLTQGPVCLFQPTIIKTRKTTHPNSTSQLQLSWLGVPQTPSQTGIPTYSQTMAQQHKPT